MTPQEQALTDHYLGLLARTDEDFRWRDIQFIPTQDGNRHVECGNDGSWTTMITDRGHESGRRRHTDLHELMFSLCAEATWDAALSRVRAPNQHADVLHDRAAALQVDIMRRIDPNWADRLDRNHAKWRATRARLAASDARRERLGTARVWLLYTFCALILAASAALMMLDR